MSGVIVNLHIIDVFDAPAPAFHESQATPIQELNHELFRGSGVGFPANHLAELIEEFFRRGHFSLDLFQDVKYCIRQCINLLTFQ